MILSARAREVLRELSDAKAELALRARERDDEDVRPLPLELADDPTTLTYRESVGPRGDTREVLVVLRDGDPPFVSADAPDEVRLAAVNAVIDALESESSPLHRRLHELLATPPWKKTLAALEAAAPRRRAPAADAPRLAFRISLRRGFDVEPLIQAPKKQGGFTSGRAIKPERARFEPGLLLTQGERAFLADLAEMEGPRSSGARTRKRARALTFLAGHEHVYFEDLKEPIRVERAPLVLELVRRGDGHAPRIKLGELEVRGSALVEDQHVVFEVDRGRGLLVFADIDEGAQSALDALHRYPSIFPDEALEPLAARLFPLTGALKLKLPEHVGSRSVPPDPRLVARLAPLAPEGLEVVLLARPVAGGRSFPPGEGEARVVGLADGLCVTCERDLDDERARATALAERLGLAPDELFTNPFRFRVATREPALDLLLALGSLGDQVIVDWPEGEVRIVSSTPTEFRVKLAALRDWFGVSGTATVDGAPVDLQKLLDALRQRRRFVELGPRRFLQITAALAERLAPLDALLGEDSGKLGFSPYRAVEAGDALLAAAVELEELQAFADAKARLQAAASYEPVMPKLTARLRSYQREGFQWLARLAEAGAGACLADEMGLGKTLQTLALLEHRKASGPALVVAPTSVAEGWVSEAARFAPTLKVRWLRDASAVREVALGPGDVLVVSYDVLVRAIADLEARDFGTFVLDEAQAVKNASTQRSQCARRIRAGFRVALTGTPVENHVGELWSLFRVILPGLLGSYESFRERFAVPIDGHKDPVAREALARTLRPFLLRREKAEVAPELPRRLEVTRAIELSDGEREMYDAVRAATLHHLATSEDKRDARFVVLAALTRLRRIACHPRLEDDASTLASSKLRALLDLVYELRATGHRALVFSQFTSHLALVKEALLREGFTLQELDGSTPAGERSRRVEAFQAGVGDLFLISLKAGGTGLNLTAADYVIHLDPWWNPAVEDQASDRAHRIGQPRPVTIVRLVAQGTIEELVLSLHADKRELARALLDGADVSAKLPTNELIALMQATV